MINECLFSIIASHLFFISYLIIAVKKCDLKSGNTKSFSSKRFFKDVFARYLL